MFEKRKYGTKIRYRVTASISNKQAKAIARILREFGFGCQLDTWKGGFAVWCDTKKIHSGAKKSANTEAGARIGQDFFFDVEDMKAEIASRSKKQSRGVPDKIEGFPYPIIDLTQVSSNSIAAVRYKNKSYSITKRGSKDTCLRAARWRTQGGRGYPVILVRFKDKWGLGVGDWSLSKIEEVTSTKPKESHKYYSVFIDANARETKKKPHATEKAAIDVAYRRASRLGIGQSVEVLRGNTRIGFIAVEETERLSGGVLEAKVPRTHTGVPLWKDFDTSKPDKPKKLKASKSATYKHSEHRIGEEFTILINREGTSNKFWGYWKYSKSTALIVYGRIGAEKYTGYEVPFESVDDMSNWIADMVRKKKLKGYKSSNISTARLGK